MDVCMEGEGEGKGGRERRREGMDGWMDGWREGTGGWKGGKGEEGMDKYACTHAHMHTRTHACMHPCTHTPPPVQHQRFVEWEESACSFSWHHWPCRERDTLSPHATPDLQTPCTYVHTVQYLRTVCT